MVRADPEDTGGVDDGELSTESSVLKMASRSISPSSRPDAQRILRPLRPLEDQIVRVEDVSLAKHDRPLDRVFEGADVARPVVVQDLRTARPS